MNSREQPSTKPTLTEKGMTLVELLLAMAIIAFILAAAYGVSNTLLHGREKYAAVSQATHILNALEQLIRDDLKNVYLQAGDEDVIWTKVGSSEELHIITTNSLISNNGELVEVVYSWETTYSGVTLQRLEKKWPDEELGSDSRRFELAKLKTFEFSPINHSQQNAWTGNMLDPNWAYKSKSDSNSTTPSELDDYIPGFRFHFSLSPDTITVNDRDRETNDEQSSENESNTLSRNFIIYFAGNRSAFL